MGKSNNIEKLYKAINSYSGNTKDIKDIESKAKKVLKEYKTLDLYYEGTSFFFDRSPLLAAISTNSVPVFQLLIRLGASPFFKPKPEMESAMEKLANNYFSLFPIKDKIPLFEWVMKDKESPVFTWAKLKDNQQLFEEFQKSGLIPKEKYINELPIHVAIKAGRIDLVREVIWAAGSIQNAGDISRMSILNPAILAVLEGKKNALQMLHFLLEQGTSLNTSDLFNLHPLIQTITAGILFLRNVREEDVISVVKLLLEHGATLEVTNPNNGRTPLLSAMSMGYKNLFEFFLDKADAKTLNHQAELKPNYLLFQLFDKYDNKLGPLDILKLLSKLKEKGLEFDKTIDYNSPEDPFGNNAYSSYGERELSARNMSVLHFYIDKMTYVMNDPFESDKHLEIIQTLIANGANPRTKATFTQTKNEKEESSYKTKKVQTSLELTASEYLRKIADKIVGHYDFGLDASLIKMYKNENDFLKNITFKTKEEQTRLHKKFHQFRNLERVLSGERPVPYSGLPDIGKIAQLTLKNQKIDVELKSTTKPVETDDFNPQTFEAKLLNTRSQQKQSDWQALKKSIVDHVKNAESLHDFLARVEQFKKPLQLHFNITTNSKGDVISYGSIMYRFFHYFDPHKFPNSWETLRKFGQDNYGVDINTQYEPNNSLQFE